MNSLYLFTSSRLGFRPWEKRDLDELDQLNTDPKVMAHFPRTLTRNESESLLQRFSDMYEDKGYTYFAVEVLDTGKFIGFIGLAFQEYESEFTPAIDIGWRLLPSAWGKGYATEGATRCMDYGFQTLQLNRIIAICPSTNEASEHVMQKIGMKKLGAFNHPKLKDHKQLEACVCYEMTQEQHVQHCKT